MADTIHLINLMQ